MTTLSNPDESQLLQLIQLSPSERIALSSFSSEAERTTHVLRLWMHKEAYSKLLGLGSSLPFSMLDFALYQERVAIAKHSGRDLAQLGVVFHEGRVMDANGEEYGWVLASKGGGSPPSLSGERDVEPRVLEVEELVAGAKRARGR